MDEIDIAKDVFISYDMNIQPDIAERIAEALNEEGISSWYAGSGEYFGWHYDAIAEAIKNCKIFLLVLTSETVNSQYIKGEFAMAHNRYAEFIRRANDAKKSGEYGNVPQAFDIRIALFDGVEPAVWRDEWLGLTGGFCRISCDSLQEPEFTGLKNNLSWDIKKVNKLRNYYDKKIEIIHRQTIITESEMTGTEATEAGTTGTETTGTGTTVTGTTATGTTVTGTSKRSLDFRFITILQRLAPMAAAIAIISLMAFLVRFPNTNITNLPEPVPEPDVSEWEIAYKKAVELAKSYHSKEDNLTAAMMFGRLGVLQESFEVWERFRTNEIISANEQYTAGVFLDGSVKTVGENPYITNVPKLKNAVSVSAGSKHIAVLLNDQTAMAFGDKANGKCNVTGSEWKKLVQVCAGDGFTAGLRSDGRVLIAGTVTLSQVSDSRWNASDFVAISAGNTHLAGLHADGTVSALGDASSWVVFPQQKQEWYCNVGEWHDIISISAGYNYTVGLRLDGTVVTAGSAGMGLSDLKDWKNITAVSAGVHHIVGIIGDTDNKIHNVVSAGENKSGQANVENWNDVVEISAGWRHTVGLRRDGNLYYTGFPEEFEEEVLMWKDGIVPPVSGS